MTEGPGGGSQPIQPPYGGPSQPAGYSGGPWAPPPSAPTPGGGSGKSFLASLFDFSFSSFVTTRVVKVLYILVVALVGLYTLFLLALGFRLGTAAGLLFLVVVIFRMGEDVAEIRRRGGLGPLA